MKSFSAERGTITGMSSERNNVPLVFYSSHWLCVAAKVQQSDVDECVKKNQGKTGVIFYSSGQEKHTFFNRKWAFLHRIIRRSQTRITFISSPSFIILFSSYRQIHVVFNEQGLLFLPLLSALCQSSRGILCQQAWAISIETLLAILCLRWLAKSTCVWESTLFMIVFGIQPCVRQRQNQC